MKIGVDLKELTRLASEAYLTDNVALFQGEKGENGNDGAAVLLTSITNNVDGTMTFVFSNGYTHTTDNLRGATGPEGDKGVGITDLQLLGDTGYGGNKSWALYYDDDTHDILTLLNGDALDEIIAIDVSNAPYHENIYEMVMATGTRFRFSVFNGGVNLDANEIKILYESNPNTNAFTDDEKAQLAQTESHADLNGRDIENRKRENHTGAQSLDTITETSVKKIMTDVERAKLANVPTDTNQAINDILTLLNSNDINLDTLQEIVNFIKVHEVELNSLTLDNIAETLDKKIMTATERIKLAGIEDGATADQTATEIKVLYESTVNKALNSVDSISMTNGGTITWNAQEGTIDLSGPYVNLQLGQEVGLIARNNTASLIPDGTVVMETGAIGASGRLTMAPYDGIADGSKILGVLTQDTANDADGFITFFGKLRGLDTSAWAQGDELWVNGSSLTNVKPTVGVILSAGFVVNSHTTVGTIFVRRQQHTLIREV